METRQVTFCVCFLLSFSHLTYTVSKQLALLYFDYFSCYQHIKFPPHLLVTWVRGENLVLNPPVGKLISSLWFGNIYSLQIIHFGIVFRSKKASTLVFFLDITRLRAELCRDTKT